MPYGYSVIDFIRESNRIEGIVAREPYDEEIKATFDFLGAKKLNVPKVKALVAAYAPGKLLRDKEGMDVRVGAHVPPAGGPLMYHKLEEILDYINGNVVSPYEAHHEYETLHPFMDSNGRSGRAIWLWHMGGIAKAPLGFLHHFYYQALQDARRIGTRS